MLYGLLSHRDQLDAVASLLVRIADAYPLILVLDDLHWADVPTLALLRHVARFNEHTPVLLLGTYRETEVDQAHPLAQALAELRRARILDTLRIQGLGEEEVAQLISARRCSARLTCRTIGAPRSPGRACRRPSRT